MTEKLNIINEPIKSYQAGSKERIKKKKKYDELSANKIETLGKLSAITDLSSFSFLSIFSGNMFTNKFSDFAFSISSDL